VQFKDDIYEVILHINDYKNLKKAVVRLYKKYVAVQGASKKDKNSGNSDLHKESTA
jgi:hypothetical protein